MEEAAVNQTDMPYTAPRHREHDLMDESTLFFSSGMADVALWLGPYMSISSQNDICTRTQKVQKCRQITTNQKPHKTPRRPANPPARFAFRQKTKQQTKHTKGQEPAQTTTPTKRICQGTQRTYHCVTLKNMPKLIIHHDICET